jgi:RHS repeat-associated protein
MKKQLLLLLLACPCSLIHAEHSQNLSQEVPADQSVVFTATDHILLSPGFKCEPTHGNAVLIGIDAFDNEPPSSGITGGPLADDNGVVGTLKGSIDVSSLGAATYTIPIELPQGLGGLTPQLSVYYNNQQRNGLLGWAWDLAGLSAITRTGSTWYHDGKLSTVNYTDDRFCLDGQRLLKVRTGEYGGDGMQYRTEQDQMSKIVSYSAPGINGPAYFKVWTADGKILSYGNSDDSKALTNSSNHINIWLLKSVEDHYGNKITYHYQNKPDAYRLIRIDYSENENDDLSPAFRVYFSYGDRDDVEITYHGDCIQRQDALLTCISVYNNSNQVYLYRFDYQKPDPQSGYPYHLLSNITFFAGNQHYNPTRIEWGDNNYAIPAINTTNIPVTTNTISDAFTNAIKFSGDFNGDGFTDVLIVRPKLDGSDAYNKSAELFLNKGLSNDLNFDYVRSFDLNELINWIYVADFNGDGRDDILLTDRQRFASPFPDMITSTIYLSKVNSTGTLSFTRHELPSYPIKNEMLESLLIGDFLGVGRQSILIQSLTNRNSTEQSVLIHYKDVENGFQFHEFQESLASNRFYTADYNGDGATEILYKNPQGYTSITSLSLANETPHFTQLYYGAPNHWDDCFPGDFNADGCCDLLFYKESATYPWFITLASHTGLSSTSYPISSFPYESPGNYQFSLDQPNETYHHLKIGDFDGNGCSDLAFYHNNTLHLLFGPITTNNIDNPFAYTRQIDSQRIHYFSNMDICIGNFLGKDNLSFLGNISLSHLPSMTPRHEVKQITDGMGRKTCFQYDYIMPNPQNPSENDYYFLHTNNTYPSQDIFATALPIRGLTRVTTYNINNKPESIECKFQGALVHKKGKGFLGFSKTVQKDYCNNVLQKRTERYFDLEFSGQTFHPVLIMEQSFDKQGRLMASSTCSNLLYINYLNHKVFIPISDKTLCEFDLDHPDILIKKEINETVVNTHCDDVLKYNKTISVEQVMKGVTDKPDITLADHCEYYTKTTTTYYADVNDSWLINRPKVITETFHHEGEDDISRTRRVTYNGSKLYQVKSVLEEPGTENYSEHPLTKKTEYEYDLTGNIISQTVSTPFDDTSSRTESFEYGRSNGRRLLTKHTNAEGHVTRFKYHAIYDHPISMMDCNQRETLYEQDPWGITVKTIRPDGTSTCQAIRWKNDGFYQWEKSTGQATKTTEYALSGEKTRELSYSLNGEMVQTRFEYDDFGRMKKETMPDLENRNTQAINYEYDEHHRINTIRHHDGTYENIEYYGNRSNASYHSTNGQQQSESKTVNIMGWLVKSTDSNGNSAIYDYYPDGKLKWAQIEGHDETKIEFQYDGLGNRSAVLDPDYGLTIEEHNAFGELMRRVTPNSVSTEYAYDKLGNKTRCVETDNITGTSTMTEWSYGTTTGKKGLLLQIKHGDDEIIYDYDNNLHLQSVAESRGNDNFKTLYTYDKASRVESITYPSGVTVHYGYNSEGQLRCIIDDNAKVLWKLNGTNVLGAPTKITTGDGFVSYREYDPANNRLISLRTLSGERVIQDYDYNYDDFANMTDRIDNKHGINEHFSYDDLNRLTSSTDEHGENVFDYDPLGRMIRKTQSGATVFANANYAGPKPYAIKSAQSQPGVFPQERMDIEYTTFGKVASICEGEKQVSFQYGYDHQRTKMTENISGKVREKIYANSCEFITQPGYGSVTRTFLTCPTGIFAVAETRNGYTSLHYIHSDHLDSWTTISDSKGNIEQEKRFDAWGNCSASDSLAFDRGFTGHEHIRGMNLINMNGRLYDPITSSMIRPDANIQTPDFTQNFNRYAYCLNNPLTYIDPDGNTFIESALLFYLFFCTDLGYEIQKELFPIALHLDMHLSTEQIGIGLDASCGVPKKIPLSLRFHGGVSYYWRYYDNSFKGWELRAGAELCAGGLLGVSGTNYYFSGKKQVTNTVYIGNSICRLDYENDYMFNICQDILGFPKADNGDRYRTAAAKIRFGITSIGLNIFTGDPGLNHDDRRTYIDSSNGRETYTIGANGEDPDAYRAGVLYFGIGPIRLGYNSEGIRNFFQNRLAHDWLCSKDSPYFKMLDRPGNFYFHFGTNTGNSLW